MRNTQLITKAARIEVLLAGSVLKKVIDKSIETHRITILKKCAVIYCLLRGRRASPPPPFLWLRFPFFVIMGVRHAVSVVSNDSTGQNVSFVFIGREAGSPLKPST